MRSTNYLSYSTALVLTKEHCQTNTLILTGFSFYVDLLQPVLDIMFLCFVFLGADVLRFQMAVFADGWKPNTNGEQKLFW